MLASPPQVHSARVEPHSLLRQQRGQEIDTRISRRYEQGLNSLATTVHDQATESLGQLLCEHYQAWVELHKKVLSEKLLQLQHSST